MDLNKKWLLPVYGVLVFVGLSGVPEDLANMTRLIDGLDVPGAVNWLLVVVGAAGIIYGLWPRSDIDNALNREWSEEGALQLLRIRTEYRKTLIDRLLPIQTVITLIVTSGILLSFVLFAQCTGPIRPPPESAAATLDPAIGRNFRPKLSEDMLEAGENEKLETLVADAEEVQDELLGGACG